MAYRIPELVSELRYDHSVCYRTALEQFEPETAHLFRAAREIPSQGAQVHGIYMFRASTNSKEVAFPDRPAVYVAEATDDENARLVHKSLWNLGSAPYILILLPDRLRVYTGFDFSNLAKDTSGLLEDEALNRSAVHDIVEAFSSESVDVGHIWTTRKYKQKIGPNRRVDKRLLRNLQQLGEALKGIGRLEPEIAHALIGKYVYIKYLWDRGILTQQWLEQRHVSSESVLGREATVAGFASLVEALENRFNGKVFPLNTSANSGITDDHVRLTASVFMGDSLIVSSTRIAHQLYLDFQAYDFRYIPVETLSAVYEQFIENPKEKGAIYTPEPVADYLLSEVNSFEPLTPQTKVLDPACGSGIFLVLTYRRLIEQELGRQSADKLSGGELVALLSNIYGVERERDACYVAEFSLILTLLHYIEPHELHKNDDFKFPRLHNSQILHGDFFNEELEIWHSPRRFQWIVGNPPWVPADDKQEKARNWIERNTDKPVGNLSLAEAFSWRVCDLATNDAIIGLLLPATSLVNILSKKYRQKFFQKNQVLRISNFANWRDVLFPKRSALPPASVIYKKIRQQDCQQIVHHGPFCINQAQNIQDEPWTVTINEKEVRRIPYSEAEEGRTSTWKFALWGNGYDERAIERIRHLFPLTLERFCADSGWGDDQPSQGIELREHDSETEKLKYMPEMASLKRFETKKFNQSPRLRFSIPQRALVPNDKLYLRMRGGERSLRINYAPHIILSKGWDFFIYSDEGFIIPPQQIGIAAAQASDESRERLRALSVYLSSSLVRYYLFFHVPEWGFYRHRESVVLSEVRNIPTPAFTATQVTKLANLQRRLVSNEQRALEPFAGPKSEYEQYQSEIDSTIFSLFDLPADIVNSVTEFVRVRLPLDGGIASTQRVIEEPSNEQLTAYAQALYRELDDFGMDEFHPRITITTSSELVECAIELTSDRPVDPARRISVIRGELSPKQLLTEIRNTSDKQSEQCNEWGHIQSGLRLYEGPRVYLYKYPRLVDWTKSQAINDASDVIAGAMSMASGHQP